MSNHIDKAGNFVLLSDPQKCALVTVEQVFLGSPHGYCFHYLEENLYHKVIKNPELKGFLWKVARVTTETYFNKALANMSKINPKSVP